MHCFLHTTDKTFLAIIVALSLQTHSKPWCLGTMLSVKCEVSVTRLDDSLKLHPIGLVLLVSEDDAVRLPVAAAANRQPFTRAAKEGKRFSLEGRDMREGDPRGLKNKVRIRTVCVMFRTEPA